MQQALLVLGGIAILAALIGDKVKAGGWELPGPRSRYSRIGVGLVGVFLIGAAAVTFSAEQRVAKGAEAETRSVQQDAAPGKTDEPVLEVRNSSVAIVKGNNSAAFADSPVNGSVTITDNE